MSFADNLLAMPNIDGVSALIIFENNNEIARIENKPGKQGSLRLYYSLLNDYGKLTPESAQKGLELFAEHVLDAEKHPGKHPNIDLLFDVIKHNHAYELEIIN